MNISDPSGSFFNSIFNRFKASKTSKSSEDKKIEEIASRTFANLPLPETSKNFQIELKTNNERSRASLVKILDKWEKETPANKKENVKEAAERILKCFDQGSTLEELRDSTNLLTNREVLNLSGLGLEKIPVNIFEYLTHLKCLDLSENNLSSFNCEDHLPALTQLYLYKNNLTKIEGDYPNLEMLALGENSLKEFDIDLFPKLKILKLNDNKIETIKLSKKHEYLEELILKDNNQLKQLPTEALKTCKSLSEIVIDHTDIEEATKNSILQRCKELREENNSTSN